MIKLNFKSKLVYAAFANECCHQQPNHHHLCRFSLRCNKENYKQDERISSSSTQHQHTRREQQKIHTFLRAKEKSIHCGKNHIILFSKFVHDNSTKLANFYMVEIVSWFAYRNYSYLAWSWSADTVLFFRFDTMNMKMPDFNMKKLVKDAGSTFSRVVQVYIYRKIYK